MIDLGINEFIEEEVDFDNFLKSMYDENNNQVITEQDANYYVGRIKSNQEKLKRCKDAAKKMKEDFDIKLTKWLTTNTEKINRDIDFCMGKVENYYKSIYPTEDKWNKKISLPNGNIGFYKTKSSVEINNEDVIEFIKMQTANSPFSELSKYIVTTETLNTAQLRKDGSIVDGVFKVNDIAINGSNVKIGETKFNIR